MNELSLMTKESIKLLQITDTHLFALASGSLLGVNTLDSFNAVVAEVMVQNVDFEAILATGDISQDHTSASYSRFVEGIVALKKPCFWLPGNHDFKSSMESIFPSEQIQQPFHLTFGPYWQLILLDSQVPGAPYGELTDQQLELLQSKLTEYPEKHTLILLHHHPVMLGSAWLDQHALKNQEAFWSIIKAYKNVKGIICGHVHQDKEQIYHGIKVMTTPSTCIQFKPNSDEFTLDETSPGWRELELCHDGEIKTSVSRLNNGLFLPNFNAHGY